MAQTLDKSPVVTGPTDRDRAIETQHQTQASLTLDRVALAGQQADATLLLSDQDEDKAAASDDATSGAGVVQTPPAGGSTAAPGLSAPQVQHAYAG